VSRPAKYIVSDEHRFVYFVVQKVACSSIKTALLPLFDLGAEGRELVREDGTTAVHELFAESPHELRQEDFLANLEAGRYDGYFKFAFVRNPWDRLVSCYLQKFAPRGRRLSYSSPHKVKLYQGMTFAEFVEAIRSIPDREANSHFRSQHVAVCGEDGTPMVDFVGRFESLEEDFGLVAGEIGAPCLKLPHLTRSFSRGERSYRDFYDDELAEKVGERFRRDAELFGYSF
jgi:chondroitin 4-sulfotransferase 11